MLRVPVLLSGAPADPVPPPADLLPVLGDDRAECVWRNEVGGLTFRCEDADGRVRYVKWAPPGAPLDLAAEAARLGWAGRFIRVPAVLELDPAGRFLVTGAIHGESAVAERWRARPVAAARALGQGLRALHDRLPVAGCPFDWSAGARIREAEEAGIDLPAGLRVPPPVDRLVVAHGDACVPNTLLDDRGGFLAHVDLGRLGVADRWADLAIATYSLAWNYVPPTGVDLEAELLDAYGIDRDDDRIHYYRALWDAT